MSVSWPLQLVLPNVGLVTLIPRVEPVDEKAINPVFIATTSLYILFSSVENALKLVDVPV